MIYNIEKIMQDVRVCIDQNMSSEALAELQDVDTLSLDEIIKSKILEAFQRVHLEAPPNLRELESGWVLLPKDFMRLVVFEMDDWEQAVYTAISTDDPDYEKQRSRFKGIRGTPQKPVCALAIRPEGRVLEFYSCKSDEAQVSRAMYLPYPTIDEDGGVDISERCYTAVVYTAAGLTLITCGETERATVLTDMAKTYLQ